MRSVTFSDKDIAKYVNDNFVATWINRNPKFHNCDFNTEKWISEHNGEAYSTKNFCTFFTTPDLDVLHYMSGYYAPRWFRPEMESALAARVEGYDADFKPAGGAPSKMSKVHETRSRELRATDEKLQKLKAPAKLDPQESMRFTMNIASLREAVAYLQLVHDEVGKSWKREKPIKLFDVIKGYKGGNEFTEEHSWSPERPKEEK